MVEQDCQGVEADRGVFLEGLEDALDSIGWSVDDQGWDGLEQQLPAWCKLDQ